MTRSQYAGSTTPPAATLATGTGAAATQSGTKYVWLYNRTRAGVTLFSPVASIAIAPTQSLKITIPSTAKTPASDVRHTGIVLSHDNNPINGAVVATYSGNLPTTITLDRDAHFAIGTVAQRLATRASLPSDRVLGMRRYVEAEALILEWTGAEWKPVYPQTLNPYLTNTQGIGGCDRALSAITDITGIIFPDYDGNGGISEQVDYWIVNDSPLPIPAGVRIGLTVAIDNNPFSTVPDESILKAGLLQLTFLGYASTVIGVLDTTGAPATVTYQGNNPMSLVLPRELPANSAYVLGIQANFRNFDLNNTALQGSLIQVYPYFESNYSVFNPAGVLLGDFIQSDGGKRRIVSAGQGLSLKALSGSGNVKSYTFTGVGESLVPGLALNTPEQKVLITNNSDCFVAATVGDTSALRALVSTVDGVGMYGAWQAIALDPTSILELTLTHPTAIRANYPDVIAGTTATINAFQVRVYVQPLAGGTIQFFDTLISGTQGETIRVGGFVSGTTEVLADRSVDAPDFGLFTAPTAALTKVAQGSVFVAGNYNVAIAYLYSNTVTAITHSSSRGCIQEFNGNIVDLFRGVAEFDVFKAGAFAYTNANQLFTRSQRSEVVELVIPANGVVTINCQRSNIFILRLTQNVTRVQFANITAGTRLDLWVLQSGGFNITTWQNVQWVGKLAPMSPNGLTQAAGGLDAFSFSSINGTSMVGMYALNFG